MTPLPREDVITLMHKAMAALDDIEPRLRQDILESEGWLELLHNTNAPLLMRLNDYFDWYEGKRQEDAGRLLEEIAYLLFQSFRGVGNIRSFQSYAPQHDLVVDGASESWFILMSYLHLPKDGRSIVVECKNQDGEISDQQFSRLCGILQNKFSNTAHLGVFVSRTSASGFPRKARKERSLRDARATQALFHAKIGKYVVVVDHSDLERIRGGFPFAKILEAKIREVEASSGLALSFDDEWKETALPPHLLKYKA